LGLIALPQRFAAQPQYRPRLDLKYQSAEFLALLNMGEGRDLAKGNDLSPLAGTAFPVKVTRQHGYSLNFNGAQYLDTSRALTVTSTFTVFAWVRPDTLNTSYTRILETRYDSGFYLGSNTASQYALIVNNSALEGCIGGQQVVGQRDFVCGVFDNGNIYLYVNGVLAASSTATTPSSGLVLRVGYSNAGGVFAWAGDIDTIGVFNRAFLQAAPRRLYVSPSSGSSGTVNYTNANDTSVASGTTTVTGSLAKTNANDVSSASGTTTVIGNTSVTNADDSCAASGSVGSSVSGSVNYTNANDALAAAGTTTVTGSLAKTNSNDTSAASGTTTVLGASSTINANDSCVASGVAGQISGTVAYTNNNDLCSATGTSGNGQVGGHFAGVGYHKQPKKREHKKDDEIRQSLLRQIEGEQEEIEQSAAPIEVKAQAARIVNPYVAEPESVDIATLEQDLVRVKQLLEHWQAEVQRGIDEDEELLFMFH
jgi:hypothetical protein